MHFTFWKFFGHGKQTAGLLCSVHREQELSLKVKKTPK